MPSERQKHEQLMFANMPEAPVQIVPNPQELKQAYRQLLKEAGQLLYETDFHFQRARKEARGTIPTADQVLLMNRIS